MLEMVAGFLFSSDYSEVVLVKKKKPAWQFGLMNGVGGKIEEGETAKLAMSREFYEETGVTIFDWTYGSFIHHLFYFYTEEQQQTMVHFYGYADDNKLAMVETREEEEIIVVKVADLHTLPVVTNLRFLIPNMIETLKTKK